MKALVVYESMFGNTASIARAVADGLAAHFEVTLADVSTTPSASGMDLIVAGARRGPGWVRHCGRARLVPGRGSDRLPPR
jgi:hypothetical protein